MVAFYYLTLSPFRRFRRGARRNTPRMCVVGVFFLACYLTVTMSTRWHPMNWFRTTMTYSAEDVWDQNALDNVEHRSFIKNYILSIWKQKEMMQSVLSKSCGQDMLCESVFYLHMMDAMYYMRLDVERMEVETLFHEIGYKLFVENATDFEEDSSYLSEVLGGLLAHYHITINHNPGLVASTLKLLLEVKQMVLTMFESRSCWKFSDVTESMIEYNVLTEVLQKTSTGNNTEDIALKLKNIFCKFNNFSPLDVFTDAVAVSQSSSDVTCAGSQPEELSRKFFHEVLLKEDLRADTQEFVKSSSDLIDYILRYFVYFARKFWTEDEHRVCVGFLHKNRNVSQEDLCEMNRDSCILSSILIQHVESLSSREPEHDEMITVAKDVLSTCLAGAQNFRFNVSRSGDIMTSSIDADSTFNPAMAESLFYMHKLLKVQKYSESSFHNSISIVSHLSSIMATNQSVKIDVLVGMIVSLKLYYLNFCDSASFDFDKYIFTRHGFLLPILKTDEQEKQMENLIPNQPHAGDTSYSNYSDNSLFEFNETFVDRVYLNSNDSIETN